MKAFFRKSLVVCSFALLSASHALADSEPAPVAPAATATAPAYTPVRWNEDYSYLAKAPKSDMFDFIKYIPLGSDPDWYLSLGGSIRERYEYFNNFNFAPAGVAQDDDGYYLTRIFVHADAHMGKNFRFFVQGKSSMEDDRNGGPRPVDADEVDIQQMFADCKLDLGDKNSATIRFGRQDLLYGAQRLISPLDWTNNRRTFEGMKVSTVLGGGTNNLDLFWVRPVNVNKERLNNGDGDTSFAGIYDTISLPEFIKGSGTKLELYFLALNRTNARFAGNAAAPLPAKDEDRYTVGARFSGNAKPFDYDIEADYQFGTFGDQRVSAWSIAAEAGYTATCSWTPRIYLGFDAASGNDNGSTGTFGTFNQLFPLGHAYFGFIDVIGRQNIVDIHPGIEVTPIQNVSWAKKLTFKSDFHMFWRENDKDAVYNVLAGGGSSPVNAGVLRGASGSSESYIGSEIDCLLTWQYDRHLQVYGGYSHFFAGDFIEKTGASNDIDFLYFALTYSF